MTTTTIDCTPTWTDILPMLLLVLHEGDATGRAWAKEELGRMAALADRAVDACEVEGEA